MLDNFIAPVIDLSHAHNVNMISSHRRDAIWQNFSQKIICIKYYIYIFFIEKKNTVQ